MDKKKVFIGVAWPYVNGDIHIGHLAGYLLPADIYARFNRFIGNDVLMVSGSDCFGTPITVEADKRGVRPEKIVEEYHKKNVELFKNLKLSFDIYTKTANENHIKVVQDIFTDLLKKGFIFKNKSNQYYSEEEKKFLPDRYVEGVCPNCGNESARGDQCDNCGIVLEQELKEPKSIISGGKVILKETEHYFFDWPKFEDFLKNYLGHSNNWRSWVLNESLGWLKTGLKPRPITRDLEWGIDIPKEIPKDLQIEGAEHKKIYVWFEAVIGYLSASIEWAKNSGNPEKWKEWWHEKESFHAYFMGKDNLIFHTLFWPSQLHGYDEKLHLPDFPAVNQFLNLEGHKFSKSRGVTIDSDYIVKTYGLDPVRFYLCLIMPEKADANFSWADFVSKHNSLLIGNIGNFINRTLTLAKGINFKDSGIEAEVNNSVLEIIGKTKKDLGNLEFKKYAEDILELADFGNKYLSRKEPWLIKDKESEEFKKIMVNSIFITLGIFLVIKPLLIETFDNMSSLLSIDIKEWPDNEKEFLTELMRKIDIQKPAPLFKKIDEEVAEKERSKLQLK